MKKKLLSLALALAACLSLAVPAYAAPVTIKAPSGDMTVTLSDATLTGTGTVYGESCKVYSAPAGSTLSAVGDEYHVTHWYFRAQQISENEYTYDDSWYQPIPSEGITLPIDGYDMLAVTIGADVEETFIIKYADNAAPAGFPDVAPSSAFASAINWAVEQNIAAGYGDGTFRPGNTCTVSHILTFLWRANGRPGAGDNERTAVAAWAKGLGIDTSDLSAPCTRAMAVTYLWKAAGSPAPSKAASFADVPAGADYASAVSWALEEGIAGGIGGNTFSPGGTCTRGQIVTFLYRQKA